MRACVVLVGLIPLPPQISMLAVEALGHEAAQNKTSAKLTLKLGGAVGGQYKETVTKKTLTQRLRLPCLREVLVK